MISALSGSLPAGGSGAGRDPPGRFPPRRRWLARTVQSILQQDPFSGTVFVFRSKRADRVKLLVYDGTGLVLIWKRLERGRSCGHRRSRRGDSDLRRRSSPICSITHLDAPPAHGDLS